MSHSNQCEDAKCQQKLDTERDELHASLKSCRCFFDDHQAAALLNGVYLCDSHAICNSCLKRLTKDGLTCRCDKYGYAGHEELLWCSEKCLEQAHPEPDRDNQPKEE